MIILEFFYHIKNENLPVTVSVSRVETSSMDANRQTEINRQFSDRQWLSCWRLLRRICQTADMRPRRSWFMFSVERFIQIASWILLALS